MNDPIQLDVSRLLGFRICDRREGGANTADALAERAALGAKIGNGKPEISLTRGEKISAKIGGKLGIVPK